LGKIWKGLFIALCLLSAVVLTTTSVITRSPTVTGAERDPRQAAPAEAREETILLLGLDESGLRPDSIMLFRVREDGITMLSIPRDTKVEINGSAHKINAAIVRGSRELLIEKIEQLTGVTPDHFVSMKPGTFAAVVDALGGVEYTVEQDMYYSDPGQDLYIRLKAGKQMLDGKQCEHYCRYRRYLLGDLTRTEHQQKLLRALIEQKLKISTLTSLPKLWSVYSEMVETDLTIGTVAELMPTLRKLAGGTVEFTSLTLPGEYNDMKREGVSYYLPDLDAAKTIWK